MSILFFQFFLQDQKEPKNLGLLKMAKNKRVSSEITVFSFDRA